VISLTPLRFTTTTDDTETKKQDNQKRFILVSCHHLHRTFIASLNTPHITTGLFTPEFFKTGKPGRGPPFLRRKPLHLTGNTINRVKGFFDHKAFAKVLADIRNNANYRTKAKGGAAEGETRGYVAFISPLAPVVNFGLYIQLTFHSPDQVSGYGERSYIILFIVSIRPPLTFALERRHADGSGGSGTRSDGQVLR
jgi:hypothetical protein